MKICKTKRLAIIALALALALSLTVPALADDITASQEQTQTYTYTAPTSPVAIDDNIITASAHRAASPSLGMMGVSAISGFGMINGGAPADLAAAQSSAALGIWGTSLNSNPDPYFWNYFYNYYAAENGLELSSDALLNSNVAASPVMADSTLVEEYGNLSVSIYTRPDILIGTAADSAGTDTKGYDAQIATIRSFASDSEFYREGDENYDPKLVSYQTTTIKEMIWSVHQIADAISAVSKETGKTTRYGDVQKIADDYEAYVYGIVAYVRQQLEAKGLDQKCVAVVTEINEDGTYTLADSISMSATSLVRAYEYTMTTCDSLVDEIGGTTATLDQLLTADAIITINNANITQNDILESFKDKTYDGILITNTPATLYGMTMNSVENAMGYAYVIGSIYSDVIDIDPVELCAYFYQRFWHITDLDSMAAVIKTNFANTILPKGVSSTLSASYSESNIQKLIDGGMAYLKANPGKFTGEPFVRIGMGSAPAKAGTFTDVAANAYYADAVEWAVAEGITTGATATTFAPDSACTRAQIVTFLYRAAGEPKDYTDTEIPFVDVSPSDYYYEAVKWTCGAEITQGIDATHFGPSNACTRAQAVTFMFRASSDTEPEDSESAFTDVSRSAYYFGSVAWAVAGGITHGTDAVSFSPDGVCTRGQIVTFLYRDRA